MNTLIRHIEYLASRKDCVVIPDFGAILASNVSADYDLQSNIINPPYRSYTFNSELRRNDGMLVTSIQRAEGLSYEAALRKVQSGVEALVAQLRFKGVVALGHIGTVSLNADEGVMTFTSNICPSMSPVALWLPPVSLVALADEHVIEPPILRKPESWYRKAIRAAASVALLLGICFVASTPLSVDDALMASMAPEVTSIAPEDIIPATDVMPAITVALPQTSPESAIDTEAAIAQLAEAERQSRYYVIVASLPSRQEAEQYISESADGRLRLFARGKYYRVYTSTHPTIGQAYSARLEESKMYPGAWVCKK